jgi:hypothetical protein
MARTWREHMPCTKATYALMTVYSAFPGGGLESIIGLASERWAFHRPPPDAPRRPHTSPPVAITRHYALGILSVGGFRVSWS